METRDIEILLTLAEELHFGRTAERLHLSQARVSQVIRKLERRVGAPLFERTSRRVKPTPIGRRLCHDLQQALDLIQTGLARAEAAALDTGRALRLGVMGILGLELRRLVDAFRDRYPGSEVQITEFHFSDPFTPLRTGQADLHLLWLPVREPDLTVGPVVLTEGRVLAVAAGHPLAARDSASLEDLGDHLVVDGGAGAPDYWVESMVPWRTPSGRRIGRGPSARTFHEVLSLVAEGRCVSPLNAHVTRYYSHPGVVFLPIADAPATRWALTWRTAGESAHIRALAQTARDIGAHA
ncbi:LysR family transcriptional regulator [Planomonospora corallina]|uniref:LysR family transcriptional regulator n=1 Tax=Planomonospora corallina TaxID=1806052 RepID=A0ABV8HYN8_9ACTN